MGKEEIRLKLMSYDVSLLHASVAKIIGVIKELGIPYKGPIPLPNKKYKVTIKKSTHIYKEANESYEQTTHTVLICICTDSRKVIDSLSNITLLSSVYIDIKI